MGGVGNVHAGQLADHGLELKHTLKNALRDLRLIRRIAGDELLAGGDGLDNGGDKVAVRARAAQDRLENLVFLRHGGDLFPNLQLAHAIGKRQLVADEHIVRNALVKIVKGLDADKRKHLLTLLGGVRNIRSHIPYLSFLLEFSCAVTRLRMKLIFQQLR